MTYQSNFIFIWTQGVGIHIIDKNSGRVKQYINNERFPAEGKERILRGIYAYKHFLLTTWIDNHNLCPSSKMLQVFKYDEEKQSFQFHQLEKFLSHDVD